MASCNRHSQSLTSTGHGGIVYVAPPLELDPLTLTRGILDNRHGTNNNDMCHVRLGDTVWRAHIGASTILIVSVHTTTAIHATHSTCTASAFTVTKEKLSCRVDPILHARSVSGRLKSRCVGLGRRLGKHVRFRLPYFLWW